MTDALSEGAVFGLGNPLLDISASTSPDFLAKWGLEPNNAILAEDKHKGLVDDVVKDHDVKFIAGGAVQNTMRITQWLIGKPRVCTFMGCIGNDFFGRCMQFKATEDGVHCAYLTDQQTKTGHCVVLISSNGKNRSLCAFLGAANNFKKDHLVKHWNLAEKAKIFYVSGFHLTVSPPSILELAQHSNKYGNKTFCFNLSAPFISQFYSEQLLQVLPYVDILFGNETEALAFAKMKQWTETRIPEIAKLIAEMPKNTSKPRTVVITQGNDPVIVAKQGTPDLKSFEVKKLNEEQLVDTNGAGDAFVAGFLSQFILNMDIEKCIKVATYAAQQIIQQDGCSIPKHKPEIEQL